MVVVVIVLLVGCELLQATIAAHAAMAAFLFVVRTAIIFFTVDILIFSVHHLKAFLSLFSTDQPTCRRDLFRRF